MVVKIATFDKLEETVVKGEPPDKDLLPFELNTYYAILGMYQAYRGKYLDRAAAKKLKAALQKNYDLTCKQHARYCVQDIQYQYNIRMAGTLRAELVKAENKDDAFRIALQIISRMTGEEETERIVKEKWT